MATCAVYRFNTL